MKKRNRMLLILAAVVIAATTLVPAWETEAAPGWIYYDSGIPAHAGSSFKYQGVRFSLSEDVLKAPLLTIYFYYSSSIGQCPVTIHITSFDHRTELVTPIEYTAINGWNEIDVSDFNIFVPHNFYIILESHGCGYPLSDDEASADRSFKGRFLGSLNTRMSYNLLIRAEAGLPVSAPTLNQWVANVTEKVKIRIQNHPVISESNYSEKWTLYTDGSFGTENNLYYGTWKQKGKNFRIFLDPEDIRKDIISMLENMFYNDIADVLVVKINFTWLEKRDGTIKGEYKAYASVYFQDNGIGSIIIQRSFTGTPSE